MEHDKNYYRVMLRQCRNYIKLSVLADEFGIARSNLSLFLKDESHNYVFSIETLVQFYDYIHSKLETL